MLNNSKYIYLANSLTCYSCDSMDACRNPSEQICNDKTANDTSTWLAQMHGDIPFIAHSDKFKCMNMTYALNSGASEIIEFNVLEFTEVFCFTANVRTHEFLGCFHPQIDVCKLKMNISHSNIWYRQCDICEWDLCNKNPAGSFSKSTYTIIVSIVGLLLATKMI
ncbi:hypothetical protein KR093_010016 [Drosophila rubida]|uniref:Uncharacterized protein n=1 Tax=Drosophila rubida TaxID=30044 RepID=A0AAD4K5W5_9MUSC|nr:hypothetical protein KR093_010016 [Drosophila rubida]